jgi:bifunctional enzyme CysN/CysC
MRRATRSERRGATLWLTGLPAAGKSTLAATIETCLIDAGRPAYVLDGDVLRLGLNADLTFSAAARDENVRRTAHVAALLGDAGVIAIVALVSPYRRARLGARQLHEANALPFIEVFVDTPVSECEARDPKGLYARARRGLLTGLTGFDEAYEPPTNPEVVVHTVTASLEAMAERVLAALEAVTAEDRVDSHAGRQ